MTINPTTTGLPQLGQAVTRLLDAIAADPHYQRDGHVTYQYQPKSGGRWKSSSGHTCGTGTITTAERNHVVTVEVAGPTIKTLTLTPIGNDYLAKRQARRIARMVEPLNPITMTIADLLQRSGPDDDGRMITVEASVMIQDEQHTSKGAPWAVLTLDDGTGLIKAMVYPRPYTEAGAELLMPSEEKLLFTGRLDVRDNEPRLVVQTVQVVRKVDA
ncbi:hypothetical protein [Nonomuraea sp. NPDC050786]|uniref:hypothetical protein n=1 Tax=Nonomuraea sp. NPDC050786 TaxID=3154840 RepID=UPI003408E0E4